MGIFQQLWFWMSGGFCDIEIGNTSYVQLEIKHISVAEAEMSGFLTNQIGDRRDGPLFLRSGYGGSEAKLWNVDSDGRSIFGSAFPRSGEKNGVRPVCPLLSSPFIGVEYREGGDPVGDGEVSPGLIWD